MTFALGELTYVIVQTKHIVPAYQLQREGDPIAAAQRATLSARYSVDCAGKVWTLKALGLTERKYALLSDQTKVGVISPTSFFNPYREIVVDLPDEIAAEVQVFMTWIVTNSWSGD